jgi:hypothetical protein
VLLMDFLPIFTDGRYKYFTDVGNLEYIPFWGQLVILETVAHVLGLVALLILAHRFFSKSRRFPALYIQIRLAWLAYVVIDAILVSLIFPLDLFELQASTIPAILGSIIAACIWIPYMLYSKRVKRTFIN